jgi:hypothetical protein
MKALVTTLLIVLGIAITRPIFATGLTDDHEKKPVATTFQAAVLPAASLNAIQVFIDKPVGKSVAIRIFSDSGVELDCQYVQKRAEKCRLKFNLESLADGKYKVVVTDGQTSSVYPFTLSTQTPVVATRTIVLS